MERTGLGYLSGAAIVTLLEGRADVIRTVMFWGAVNICYMDYVMIELTAARGDCGRHVREQSMFATWTV